MEAMEIDFGIGTIGALASILTLVLSIVECVRSLWRKKTVSEQWRATRARIGFAFTAGFSFSLVGYLLFGGVFWFFGGQGLTALLTWIALKLAPYNKVETAGLICEPSC